MKIYTKGGDQGETGLFGGVRVPKDHLRIRTYGTLDELNAILGIVMADGGTGGSGNLSKEVRERLSRLQGELFQLGAELATPPGKSTGMGLIDEHHVQALEKEIDQMELQLRPLKTFILPGGDRSASLLHLARTVSRRAEREMVALHHAEPLRPLVMQYINRLSDYLFVTARFINHLEKIEDVPWVGRRG